MATGRPWSIDPYALAHNKDVINPVCYWNISYKTHDN